ncbi:MAG: hypothetical protein AAGI09_09090 [Pseudomonadota bacterium]
MTWRILLVGALLCTACTSVAVDEEIKSAKSLLAETSKALEPTLKPAAEAEFAQARGAMIRAGEPIARLENCKDSNAYLLTPDCRLVSKVVVSPDQPVNATQVRQLLVAMDLYLDGIAQIATSEDSAKINEATSALTASLVGAKTDGLSAFAPLAGVFEGRQDAVASALGFLAEQARISSLKRIVGDADKVWNSELPIAAAYFPESDAMITARSQLLLDEKAAEALLRRGDEAAYDIAMRALQEDYDAVIKLQRTSPAYAFFLLRRVHGDLAAKLNGNASPQDVLQTLREIEAILTGLKGAA